MSLSVDMLAKYAELAVKDAEENGVSAELRTQCADLAAYARKTKWHFSARPEAKRIARVFESVRNFPTFKAKG